jgi:regulator of replication initiation timing
MKELDELLFHISQVFDGWHADGTAWSEWDESVRKRVTEYRIKLESVAPQEPKQEHANRVHDLIRNYEKSEKKNEDLREKLNKMGQENTNLKYEIKKLKESEPKQPSEGQEEQSHNFDDLIDFHRQGRSKTALMKVYSIYRRGSEEQGAKQP